MNNPTRPQCFLSYCHHDIDRDTLDYLVHVLTALSNGQYDLLYDKHLSYGTDFYEFMALLETVDSVILLLSPAYNQRVTTRQRGVYAEYTRIIHRFSELQAQRRNGKKIAEIPGYFDLIPILFSGDINSSVPDDIKSLKHLDLVGFRVMRNQNNKYVISDYARRQYLPDLSSINAKLQTIKTLKTDELETLFDKYFSRLFIELKADWHNPRDQDFHYVENLFVKTQVFKRVQNQAVYFLIGRKGSGKSTVTGVLATQQGGMLKRIIKIDAEQFNLQSLYSLLNPERVRSDMTNVFQVQKCFQYAWELFIATCCMDDLVQQCECGQLNEYQTAKLVSVCSFIHDKRGDSSTDDESGNSAYFTYALACVNEFMDYCIQKARHESNTFYSDIERAFTLRNLFGFVFGKRVLDAFKDIIAYFRRGFLVTLDGLDTAFDMFRRESILTGDREQLLARSRFEIEWLRALLRVVLRAKEEGFRARPWYALMEFCITVPKGRFLELMRSERDTYRYSERYCALHWSGVELAILLRKRLEELGQCSTSKIDKHGKRRTPEDRLMDAFGRICKHLPTEISFQFNGRSYTTPLFMYVLRHTFWRPRDVLWYYARLLATSEIMRKNIKRSQEIQYGGSLRTRLVKSFEVNSLTNLKQQW